MTVHSWDIFVGRLEVFTLQFPTILVCLHNQGLHTRDFTKIATSRTTLWATTSRLPCHFHYIVSKAGRYCHEQTFLGILAFAWKARKANSFRITIFFLKNLCRNLILQYSTTLYLYCAVFVAYDTGVELDEVIAKKTELKYLCCAISRHHCGQLITITVVCSRDEMFYFI